MREWDAHNLLFERLKKTKCKWILSSYDKPEIRHQFEQSFIISVQSSSGMNTEKNGNTRVMNKEILVTNFEPQSKIPVASKNLPQASLDLGA
jgi:hypothetical protein